MVAARCCVLVLLVFTSCLGNARSSRISNVADHSEASSSRRFHKEVLVIVASSGDEIPVTLKGFEGNTNFKSNTVTITLMKLKGMIRDALRKLDIKNKDRTLGVPNEDIYTLRPRARSTKGNRTVMQKQSASQGIPKLMRLFLIEG
eukprot:TRINITY_DN34634_c0_g1_i1.p1 TRINITY_DN34634_c0_g1~~TRINITY_DN34634_c0_g1_i1.p1  ORF type:complete len:164 (-),score=9.19 TRINITY_DN34634_c0_g1_i1:249-686(-)